jgi:hypothetical protein
LGLADRRDGSQPGAMLMVGSRNVKRLAGRELHAREDQGVHRVGLQRRRQEAFAALGSVVPA